MPINVTGRSSADYNGINSFRTQKEAEEAARLTHGSEAIVKEDNGYKLYKLEEVNNVNTLYKQATEFDPNIVAFSIENDETNVLGEYKEQTVNSQEVYTKNFLTDLTTKIGIGVKEDDVAKLLGFKSSYQMTRNLKNMPPEQMDAIFNQLKQIAVDLKSELDAAGIANPKDLPKLKQEFKDKMAVTCQEIFVKELKSAITNLYPKASPGTINPKFEETEGLTWQPQELAAIYNSVSNMEQGSGSEKLLNRPVTFRKCPNVELSRKESLTDMFNKMMNISSTDGTVINIREGAITGDLNKQVRSIVESKLFIAQRINDPSFYNYTRDELTKKYGAPNLNRWFNSDKVGIQDKSVKQRVNERVERASLYEDLVAQYSNSPNCVKAIKKAIRSELLELSNRGNSDTKTLAKVILDKLDTIGDKDKDALLKLVKTTQTSGLAWFNYGVFQQVSFLTEKALTTMEIQDFLNLSRPPNKQIKTDGEYGYNTMNSLKQFQLDQTLSTFEGKIKENLSKAYEKGDKPAISYYEQFLSKMQDMRSSIYETNITSFKPIAEKFNKICSSMPKDFQGSQDLIKTMRSDFTAMEKNFASISDRKMDEKTINLIVTNMFNIMQDGNSNLLDNLIVHESGHFIQTFNVGQNADGEATNLTKEWKKLEGFSITKPSGVSDVFGYNFKTKQGTPVGTEKAKPDTKITETWNPGDIDAFSSYGTTSRNEDIAECFRGYTSINNDLKHPTGLMQASPIKFLTINAVMGRYDPETVLKIATLAFGSEDKAKEALANAFKEMAGISKGNHYFKSEHFSPEFLAKIFDAHKDLINNMNVLSDTSLLDPNFRNSLNKVGFNI